MLEYVIVKNFNIINKKEDKTWVHNLLFIKVIHIFVLFFLPMKGGVFVCMFGMCILESNGHVMMNGN
jgi:hypothetical protein